MRKFRNRSQIFVIIPFLFSLGITLISAKNQDLTIKDKKYSCGAMCFFEICKKLGVEITMDKVEKLLPYNEKGTSLLEISKAAKKIGLNTKGLRIDYDRLMDIESPVIAFINNNHFVVVNRAIEDKVFLENPPINDTIEIDRDNFENIWKGEILLISKGEGAEEKNKDEITPDKSENLASGPKIYVDELYYDFGRQSCFGELKHIFKVSNIGNEDLKFYELRRSDCDVMIKSDKWFLKAGDSTELEVIYYPNGFTGFQDVGISLLTNDKECPTFGIHCYADLYVDLIVSPLNVDFGNVVTGSEYVKEINITVPEIKDFIIEKIDVTSNSIKTNIEQEKCECESGSKYKLFVKLNAKDKLGHFKEWFTLHTNHPRKKEIKIYVYGDVKNRITVYPDKLSFGLIKKSDENVSRVVQIYSDDEFNIKEVKIPNNLLSYSISAVVGDAYMRPLHFPPKHYEVTFVRDKELKLGKYNDKIEIFTDNPLQPTIEIPFFLIACE